MWIGLLILVVTAALIAAGQWFVTRPTTKGVVDTKAGRAKIEAEFGKNTTNIQTRGLP